MHDLPIALAEEAALVATLHGDQSMRAAVPSSKLSLAACAVHVGLEVRQQNQDRGQYDQNL